MRRAIKKNRSHLLRRKRSRQKIKHSASPRLSVFRSNKALYAQIIDDQKGQTLASVSSKEIKNVKASKDLSVGLALAHELGKLLAKRAEEKKVKQVVFDRRGYAFHGKVKALADGARKGGLKI